jgi:hypothetical protein
VRNGFFACDERAALRTFAFHVCPGRDDARGGAARRRVWGGWDRRAAEPGRTSRHPISAAFTSIASNGKTWPWRPAQSSSTRKAHRRVSSAATASGPGVDDSERVDLWSARRVCGRAGESSGPSCPRPYQASRADDTPWVTSSGGHRHFRGRRHRPASIRHRRVLAAREGAHAPGLLRKRQPSGPALVRHRHESICEAVGDRHACLVRGFAGRRRPDAAAASSARSGRRLGGMDCVRRRARCRSARHSRQVEFGEGASLEAGRRGSARGLRAVVPSRPACASPCGATTGRPGVGSARRPSGVAGVESRG